MIRILLFIALIYFSVSLPSYLFVVAAFLYMLLYSRGYELLVLGAFLDALFGGLSGFMVPQYTLIMLAIVVLSEYTRPLLRWNN